MYDEHKNEIIGYSQRNKNGMRLISVYIPEEWVAKKRNMGVTWRVLLARAIQQNEKLKDLKETLAYYEETLAKRNNQISVLNEKLWLLEQKIDVVAKKQD